MPELFVLVILMNGPTCSTEEVREVICLRYNDFHSVNNPMYIHPIQMELCTKTQSVLKVRRHRPIAVRNVKILKIAKTT